MKFANLIQSNICILYTYFKGENEGTEQVVEKSLTIW